MANQDEAKAKREFLNAAWKLKDSWYELLEAWSALDRASQVDYANALSKKYPFHMSFDELFHDVALWTEDVEAIFYHRGPEAKPR